MKKVFRNHWGNKSLER